MDNQADLIQRLETAIATLEAQRATLGDLVVDTGIEPLRQRLKALQPSPVAEQRKQVTILFADLVDFTALSERMDAEDVREMVNAYFTRWTRSIERHSGVVEKFIGDAVMAVFGLEAVHEDDPERAVRAALDMRQELAALNHEFSQMGRPRLKMRIGIHTGPVVVSFLPERKGQAFVIVGPPVNLASRLQSHAPEDSILISHDTYRHVRGVFNLRQEPPLVVKGKSEPVQVYVVLEAKPRALRMSPRGVEGVETRLVGRAADLQHLQDALWRAVDGSTLVALTLVGDPGLGKTRLVTEFTQWLDLLPQVLIYRLGRSSPSLQDTSFGLLRDLMAFAFDIQDSDPPDEVQRKVVRGVCRGLRDGQETDCEQRAHWIWALVGTSSAGFDFSDSPYLPGAGLGETSFDARQFRQQALQFLAQYLQALALRRPLVMVLEDIHWADDSSLDALVELAGWMRGVPVFVLFTARPNLFERRADWVAASEIDGHARLDLHPLTPEESRSLVEDILQAVEDLPPALSDLVVSQADGNPFYIEELIKMLMEDGVIGRPEKGGRPWTVDASRLAQVRVPPTLAGVLQARFDSLQPVERLALQRAAVVGRVFWDQAVAYIGRETPVAAQSHLAVRQPAGKQPAGKQPVLQQSSESGLPVMLDALRQREMIYPHSGSAFEDTREFIFKHAMLRDATYETLLKRDRRQYHAAAARWLVTTTRRSQRSGEWAALIAAHWEAAADLPSAAEWYAQAGQQAARRFANAEAIRCLSRALELLPPEARRTRFDCLLERQKVYDLQGQRQLQAQDLAALDEVAQHLGAEEQIEVVLYRARYGLAVSDYAAAIQHSQRLLELTHDQPNPFIQAWAYLEWGGALWRQGDYAGARPRIEKALEFARQAQDLTLQIEALRNLGILLEADSDLPGARQAFEQCLALVEPTGDRLAQGRVLNSLGIVAYNQLDYAACQDFLDRALEIKRQTGDRRGEGSTLQNLALLYYSQGNLVAMQAALETIVSITHTIDDLEGEAIALGGLGALALYCGNHAAAASWLEKAQPIAREIGDQQLESEQMAYQSLLRLRTGDPHAALEAAQVAVEMARQVGLDSLLIQALTRQGRAQLALGDPAAARQAFEEALRLPFEFGQRRLLLETMAGMAEAELMAGSAAEAQAWVEKIMADLVNPESGQWSDLDGTEDAFQVYASAVQVLRACQDPRSEAFLQAGRDLLQRRQAQWLDPQARRNEFRQVFDNLPAARILLANDIQGQPGSESAYA